MKKLDLVELKIHAEKAYAFYKTELGAPEGAIWIINPRDFHYLKREFDGRNLEVTPMPQLLKLDAVVAHVWRKPPIIAMNIDAIEFLQEESEDD